MSYTVSWNEIKNNFNQVLENLSEKEQFVIQKRIWLNWEKETLKSIGLSFPKPITRERVRQIENSGITKIGRILKTSILWQIQEKALSFIKMHWWVILRDKVINEIIKELNISDTANKNIIDIVINSDIDVLKSKPKNGTQTYFYQKDISPKLISTIHSEAIKILRKKKDVMKIDELYTIIQNRFAEKWLKIKKTLIDSSLEVFTDIVKWEEDLIWLTRWKILNPQTLREKTLYIMKKEKIPMHYIDITNKIIDHFKEDIKINTIHNELIKWEDFVLIGRWIYALKEWWFTAGTVLDVIVSTFKKFKKPMSLQEISKEVLKTRKVKTTTIYMNLQNKKVIERVWRNFYYLKWEEY